MSHHLSSFAQNRAASDILTPSMPVDLNAPLVLPLTSGKPASSSNTDGKTLVFIDTSVGNYQSLIQEITPEAAIYVLNPLESAIAQITDTLLAQSGVSAVHILSHGSTAGLQLGHERLGADTIDTYTNQLKSWGQALTADADILLYGCNVGHRKGGNFLQRFANLTGADIAASTDLTGNAALGGDWVLEHQVGRISDTLAIWQGDAPTYNGVLDAQLSEFAFVHNQGIAASPGNLAAYKDDLFFTVTNSTGGTELRFKPLYEDDQVNHVSPGQSIDLPGLPIEATIEHITVAGNTLYVTAQTGTEALLWQINPTLDSTWQEWNAQRIDGWPVQPTSITGLLEVDSRLLVASDNGLWSMQPATNDYTPPSPKQIMGTSQLSNFSQLMELGDTVYFTADDAGETRLYRLTQPTISGPNGELDPFAESVNVPGGSQSNYDNFHLLNGTLYFTSTSDTHGTELYRLEANMPMAELVIDLNPGSGSSNPGNLLTINESLFFIANDGVNGPTLWRIEAHANGQVGTNPQAISTESSGIPRNIQELTQVGDKLFFTAEDWQGIRQLWRFDSDGPSGFAESVYLGYGNDAGNPMHLTSVKSNLYFTTLSNDGNSRELKSLHEDGWEVRSVQTSGNGNPLAIDNLTSLNGRLYFTTSRDQSFGPYEHEVWSVTPSESSGWDQTDKIGQINSDTSDLQLSQWQNVDGKIFLVGPTNLFVDPNGQPAQAIYSIASEAPYLGIAPSDIHINENSPPTFITENAWVDDSDTFSFGGGSLVVKIKEAQSFQQLGHNLVILPDAASEVTVDGRILKFQGQQIATYSGGIGQNLVIEFDQSQVVSRDAVQALLSRIAYYSTADNAGSNNTSSGSIRSSLEIQLNDGAGGRATHTNTIWRNQVNDAPIIGIRHDYSYAFHSQDGWLSFSENGSDLTSGQINTIGNLSTRAGLSLKTDQPIPTQPGYTLLDSASQRLLSLDAESGYFVDFQLNLVSEYRGNNADRNLDGRDDRAGFSVLVTSSDATKAIELGFFRDRIWAQEDGKSQSDSSLSAAPNSPYRTLFTQAESTYFNTTERPVNYRLAVKGESYTLYADGQAILNGRLRDYSDATITSGPNPYNTTNTLFFGDNTTAASVNAQVFNVSIVGTPIVNETVIDTATGQSTFSNSNYFNNDRGIRQIGQIATFDLDQGSIPQFSNTNYYFSDYSQTQFDLSNGVLRGTRLDFENQTSYTVDLTDQNYVDHSLKVLISDVDDRLDIIAPTNQTILEDEALTFSNAMGNAIQLSDADGNQNQVEVQLSAPNSIGSWELLDSNIPDGVSYLNSSSNGLTIRGALHDVNTALDGLMYRPDQDLNINNRGTLSLSFHFGEVLDGGWVNYFQPHELQLDITPVNDAPDFSVTSNHVVNAGVGEQTVDGWLNGFIANGMDWNDESSQAIAAIEIVGNDRPDLFEGVVTVNESGMLVFTPISSATIGGVATISVRVRDDGGTENGGIDTSEVKTFTITVNPSANPQRDWKIVANADFDGDGIEDIFWRNQANGENLIWKVGDSSISQSISLQTVRDQQWEVAGVADFTNDQRADIVWRHRVTGENYIWQMGENGQITPSKIDTVIGQEWQIAGLADITGNNQTDIFWRNTRTGENVLWQMNGINLQSAIKLNTVSDTNWEIAGFSDIDNDGRTDILWRNQSTGQNLFWKMNGTVIQNIVNLPTVFDTNWRIMGLSKTDGNHEATILWRNNLTGENLRWGFENGIVISALALPQAN